MSFGINAFQKYSLDFGLGHNGVKISLNYFDGLPDQHLIGSLGSSELRLTCKYLLKRDDTTKEKALGDLVRLVSDAEKSEQLLRNDIFCLYWSQVYAKLVTSDQKSIRMGCHEFTALLIRLMNKQGVKFLKDYVPLLLSGLYDADPAVGKSTAEGLLQCFNNDSKKVKALWSVFSKQIVHYVYEVLVTENEGTLSDERYVSKEDSESRYSRVAFGAVSLMMQLLKNVDNISAQETLYDEVLSSENLWRLLTLKRAGNLKTYQLLLQLIDFLVEDRYMDKHRDVLKMSSKRFFKSLAQIHSKNLLSVSAVLPQALRTLTILNRFKGGRIWTYDSSFKSNALALLKLGAGNSDPSYYAQLYSFCRENNLFDYQTEWIPIWRNCFLAETNRKILGRNAQGLVLECWKYFLEFFRSSENAMVKSQLRDDILMALNGIVLEDYQPLIPMLTEAIHPTTILIEIQNLLPTGISETRKDTRYIKNLVLLLINVPDSEEYLKTLSHSIFESIKASENYSENYGFYIYGQLINSKFTSLNLEVEEFCQALPFMIDKRFVELPSKLMSDYSKSMFLKNLDDPRCPSSFSDYISVVKNLDLPKDELLSYIDKLDPQILHKLLNTCADLADFVNDYIDSHDFTKSSLYRSTLLTKQSIERLYLRACATNNLGPFSSNIPMLPGPLYIHLIENTTFLTKLNHFSDAIVFQIRKSLIPIIKNNDKLAKKVAECVLLKAVSNSREKLPKDIISYSSKLIDSNPTVLVELLPTLVNEKFVSYVPHIDYRLSLVNPLGSGVNLLDISLNQKFDFKSAEAGIKYALFLDAILSSHPEYLDDNIILFLTLMNELAGDYNCLSATPADYFQEFKNTLFSKVHTRYEFPDILSAILTGTSDISILKSLVSREVSETLAFYNCTVLRKLLLNSVDYITHSRFKELPSVDAFLLDVVRGKEVSSVQKLQANTLLASFSKFAGCSEKLDRTRNMLAAEIIDVDSESATEKYFIVILLTNLLKVESLDNDGASFVPIAQQRLNMVINSMYKWLESDISFENSFCNVRLSLLEFIAELLKFLSVLTMGKPIVDLAFKTLSDSLGVCQLEDTSYIEELRIYTLKLYLGLEDVVEHGVMQKDIWLESVDEIHEALVQLMLTSNSHCTMAQPYATFCSLLNRSMNTISEKFLMNYFDEISEYLVSNSIPVSSMRVVVTVSGRLILAKQQEVVIENALQRSSIDCEVESGNITCKLPQELINLLVTNMPEEYLEYDDPLQFIKYLWYWHLILLYFKEISFSMRHDYINQLKRDNLIERLFDFVAEQIDLQDSKFWNNVSTDSIVKYNVNDAGFYPYKDSITIECKLLLSNLLYEMFNNVGAITNNWWLNIKDRSLQGKINSFVSKYISPILIEQELKHVGQSIPKLTSQADGLTIKINNIIKEIKAKYLIDDQTLEISFKFPPNYPLTNIEVFEGSRVGVSEQKWKSWIISTKRVITGMNGSVMDSLELFTKNVRLQFANFEECAICYSILHPVDRKLPTKVCPTCNNRFHGACLYKWFRSSGNNSCPLCRSEIPFRR
ncbi:ubiquitin-protein ligase RKR1 Ecym_7418 [Eremothecium cymbalariae DBVPG|uniref:E3 ubiquitin-protein ligase listerin n=1 Tax=Eremothecium cymbalariae (strain CBS 270.75 / DBVPG 7215 / KCTC 17166 / NRRL Y-17582) TaxID=931890 RepID=G8JWM7_ERECY|nr:hypothetical protein Ecym_7418 [Eremothecium cymbalariae DBVPG\